LERYLIYLSIAVKNTMNRVNDFTILELHDDMVIVVINNAMRIDHYLDPIRFDLCSRDFNGEVYIDLLLSNGLNSRRFFKSFYDGNELRPKLIAKQDAIPAEVVDKSNQYFSSHQDLLKKSILTASAKHALLFS
jgi:hypothetical protein